MNAERGGEVTSLALASSKGKSLRTTVPVFIVNQFGLDAGDKVAWEIRAQDNETIIVLKPLPREKVAKKKS